MKSDKPNWFFAAIWRIQVLLANWRSEAKGKLGISNQDYPAIRDKVVMGLLYDAIRLQAAEEVLHQSGYPYSSLREEYEVKITEYQKKIEGSPSQGAGFPTSFPSPLREPSLKQEGKSG